MCSNNLQPSVWPGSSYIIFRDHSGKFTGSIADDYGGLKITRLDEKSARRVELIMGDSGVRIRLYNDEVPVAQWSVSEDGDKFEKLTNQQSGHRPQ